MAKTYNNNHSRSDDDLDRFDRAKRKKNKAPESHRNFNNRFVDDSDDMLHCILEENED